jgi:hypothetical protein
MALSISGSSPSFSSYQGGTLTSGTAQASTSGTSIDFTGIPSWVKRITVMFNGVSGSGTSPIQIQLGTSGGVQTTSYDSIAMWGITSNTSTTGFITAYRGYAADLWSGAIVFTLLNSSTGIWVSQGVIGYGSNSEMSASSGIKTLSGTLDRVRITTVNGTDTFDAGSINILYE